MRALTFLLALSLSLASGLAAAAERLPQRNLWVELRWVESTLSAAAAAGVRDGAVVVSTGGSYSPRGQVVLSTESGSRIQALPRLLVLNGGTASVQLSESAPVQWLDYGIEADASTRGSPASGAKVYAVPRSGMATQGRLAVSVSPRWGGGQQPVQLKLSTQSQQAGEGGAQRQTEIVSSVQLPLGQWITVARSGGASAVPQRGTLSTRDAEPVTQRELQLRVDLAP